MRTVWRVVGCAALIWVVLVAGANAQQGNQYRHITVRDFIIDGPQLAARHEPVALTGAYITRGNLAVMYASGGDISMALFGPAELAQRIQPVTLLTDEASHEARAAMFDCQNMTGCNMSLEGRVTTCEMTNGFGAEHSEPCLQVEDLWHNPPPAPQNPVQPARSPISAWAAQIQARIQHAWVRPPSAHPGIDCTVFVTQVPGGNVVSAKLGACNGDDAVKQSILDAVSRASPLPPPPDPALFERNLELYFRPTD
jgi:hypothetical protein